MFFGTTRGYESTRKNYSHVKIERLLRNALTSKRYAAAGVPAREPVSSNYAKSGFGMLATLVAQTRLADSTRRPSLSTKVGRGRWRIT